MLEPELWNEKHVDGYKKKLTKFLALERKMTFFS